MEEHAYTVSARHLEPKQFRTLWKHGKTNQHKRRKSPQSYMLINVNRVKIGDHEPFSNVQPVQNSVINRFKWRFFEKTRHIHVSEWQRQEKQWHLLFLSDQTVEKRDRSLPKHVPVAVWRLHKLTATVQPLQKLSACCNRTLFQKLFSL